MKTVILAGGLGTRLQEETVLRPKPMVEIGGQPMLWHIMNIYAHYGHAEFVVALGYLGEFIKRYFLHYQLLRNSFSVNLGTGKIELHPAEQDEWQLHLIDTGLHTQTGGRLKRIADFVKDGTFMMTYGDGVADININELVRFHHSHGKLATVTAVRPPARFGGLMFDGGDHIAAFSEKPQIGEGWVSGGFFVLESKVLDYIAGDSTIFEREPLESLAADQQLVAYRHNSFWQCMDTVRDVRSLQSLWDSGKAPWKVWC